MKACVINRDGIFAKFYSVTVGCELKPGNAEVCIKLHMKYILITF